jgi:hypothetical protein
VKRLTTMTRLEFVEREVLREILYGLVGFPTTARIFQVACTSLSRAAWPRRRITARTARKIRAYLGRLAEAACVALDGIPVTADDKRLQGPRSDAPS